MERASAAAAAPAAAATAGGRADSACAAAAADAAATTATGAGAGAGAGASAALRALIARLPKAELHLHVEGSLEPRDVFRIAERNAARHAIKHATVEAAEAARSFDDLGGFIDEIRAAVAVLMTEQVRVWPADAREY
jgi:hypothetical protein